MFTSHIITTLLPSALSRKCADHDRCKNNTNNKHFSPYVRDIPKDEMQQIATDYILVAQISIPFYDFCLTFPNRKHHPPTWRRFIYQRIQQHVHKRIESERTNTLK